MKPSSRSATAKRTPSSNGTIEQVASYVRRSNPHLLTGHRVNQTFSSIVWSLFDWHNETVNVWSHLVPGMLFLHLLVQVVYDESRAWADQTVLTCYLGATSFLCFFSATYHLFSAHSERVHNVVVKLDFLGILLVIAASFSIGIYYGFHCEPHFRNFYLITCLLFDAGLLVTPFVEMDIRIRRTIFVSAVFVAVIPMTHLCLLYGMHSVVQHTAVILVLYCVAFFFYVTKFPEKYFPRTFDLFGSSHQIWHMLLVGAFVYYYYGMETVYLQTLELPECAP